MKRNYTILSVLFIGVAVILSSCSNKNNEHKVITIAISKAVPLDDYKNYIRWIKAVDSSVNYIDMYHLSYDSALIILKSCDGLLLTGGTDIYPGRHGKEQDTSRCWEPDFKRDSLEFLLVDNAIQLKKPILGVCRGHQVLNVYFGGSLIIDIPSDLDTLIKHMVPDTYGTYHEIHIKKESLLFDITGRTSGMVNSNHHQGIDVMAVALEGAAFTDDYLIEAVNLKYYEDEPFLLGVQWHPERMDYSSPLSINIARAFINACRKQ
ncbi:MAG: gamma-glutamyl-gamma-aminobutyrate hydrolase family protein [Bacteroidales bacterium]|nr:gamma-glutamyl-gamma-aminobutyrate hydrolase family protein [Bacteroidales bacterium]